MPLWWVIFIHHYLLIDLLSLNEIVVVLFVTVYSDKSYAVQQGQRR